MASVIDISPSSICGVTQKGRAPSQLIKSSIGDGTSMEEALRGVLQFIASKNADPDATVAVLLPSHQKTADGKLLLIGTSKEGSQQLDPAAFDEAFGGRWRDFGRGFALAAGVELDSQALQPLDGASETGWQPLEGAIGVIDIGYDHVTTAVRKRDVTRSLETFSGYREWLAPIPLEAPFQGTIEAIRKAHGSLEYDVLLCEKWGELRKQCIKKEDYILFEHLQGAILGTLLKEFLLEHPGVNKFVVMGTGGGRCIKNVAIQDNPAAVMVRQLFSLSPAFGREAREHMPIFIGHPTESPYVRGGLALATLL